MNQNPKQSDFPDNPSAEFCPTCKKWFIEPEEKEFIRKIMECTQCDHVRGEINER